jgi:hypothetical protein
MTVKWWRRRRREGVDEIAVTGVGRLLVVVGIECMN